MKKLILFLTVFIVCNLSFSQQLDLATDSDITLDDGVFGNYGCIISGGFVQYTIGKPELNYIINSDSQGRLKLNGNIEWIVPSVYFPDINYSWWSCPIAFDNLITDLGSLNSLRFYLFEKSKVAHKYLLTKGESEILNLFKKNIL